MSDRRFSEGILNFSFSVRISDIFENEKNENKTTQVWLTYLGVEMKMKEILWYESNGLVWSFQNKAVKGGKKKK